MRVITGSCRYHSVASIAAAGDEEARLCLQIATVKVARWMVWIKRRRAGRLSRAGRSPPPGTRLAYAPIIYAAQISQKNVYSEHGRVHDALDDRARERGALVADPGPARLPDRLVTAQAGPGHGSELTGAA